MKRGIQLLLFLFSLSIQAHDDCDEPHQFSELERYLSWNSASSEEVRRAPCKTTAPPSSTAIENYLNTLPPGNANADIHGVSFTNENPDLLEAFRKLTTMKDTLGYRLEPSAQVEIQNRFTINPSCSKVLCAVEKIWGREMGRKILYLQRAFKVNTSEFSIDGATRFTMEELDDVVLALEDVPRELREWPRKDQPIVHYERGSLPRFHQGTKTAADSNIMLYDGWSSKSSTSRQYVMFHEIAHNFSRYLGNLDGSSMWLDKSEWVKLGEEWSHGEKYCAVSNYGASHPDEDFAETMSAYRYNGKALKERCPEKYAFAKEKVFKGREFLDQNCSR